MKTIAFTAAALLLASPALAQTAPAGSGDLARMLNGGLPGTTPSPAPRPSAAAPAARPVAASAASTRPSTAPAATPAASAAPTTRSAPPATPATTSVTPTAVPEPAEPPPPPPTVLTPAAIAALPFTLDLPSGFRIDTGRPGPDFKIYTVRRGAQPFVMIYAGPSSQFPIYSGEMVQAAGRSSIVSTENGQRHALEHLFQRQATPREIHVWVSSLEGADRALAERIAQSVDDR